MHLFVVWLYKHLFVVLSVLSDIGRQKLFELTNPSCKDSANLNKSGGDGYNEQTFERRIHRLEQEKAQLEKKLQGIKKLTKILYGL